MVLRYLPEAKILKGDGSLWWAGSLQRAFEYLRGSEAAPHDVVLILNDDAVFEADFVGKGVAALLTAERNILLAQLYDAQSGKFVEVGVRVDWENLQFHAAREPDEINCFSTRGLFLRFRDMVEIGGFHPMLLPHYASDYEYTLRARRKGFRFSTSADVKIWGYEHTTGIRNLDGLPIGRFLRTIFTKRAIHNPLYWTVFVLLSCPARYLPRNLLRVWQGFFRQARAALMAAR
jgi:GT2 family glycosyltransferase